MSGQKHDEAAAVSHEYSLKHYIVGFGLSLVTTLLAFGLVMGEVLEGAALVTVIIGLAFVQLIVQLAYFLHLGGKAARLSRVAFTFMLGVVVIIVGGSLWIMANLDYHMTPGEMEKHMLEQSQKGGF